MNYKIISSAILIEWNDNPKMETVLHEMPSDLAQQFDEWLSDIEDERNATTTGGESLINSH
jgi:hypothetical protein